MLDTLHIFMKERERVPWTLTRAISSLPFKGYPELEVEADTKK